MHLLATLKIKSGKMPEAFEKLGEMVAVIEAKAGWKLVSGFHSLSGHTHTIVHLWDIGDSYDQAHARMSQASEVLKLLPPIFELVDEETTMLLNKTPYSD
jgi:NIPSNAP